MAFLVPLLLPSIINATANIALGVTNAVQGTSSDVSFKIGNQVLTTKKPFNFSRFPPEIRERIILMALESSKDLIIPPMDILPQSQPFGPVRFTDNSNRYNPLNPSSTHYRSLVGEMYSANGYPLSSWRWMGLAREWRGLIRRVVWRRCVIAGMYSYFKFEKMMSLPQFDIFTLVETLELHQGYGDPSTLYQIIRHPLLTSLSSLSIMPLYPFSPSRYEDLVPPFEFGLQLIPPTPKLQVLHFGLPLELCTNQTQRKHLRELGLRELGVTMLNPSLSLLTELGELIGEKTTKLSIRYLSISLRPLCSPALFLSPALSPIPHIQLHLPRVANLPSHPYQDQTDPPTSFAQRTLDLVLTDEDLKGRYEVWVEDEMGRWGGQGGRGENCLYRPGAVVEEVEEEPEVGGLEEGMEFLTMEEREEIRKQKARDLEVEKEDEGAVGPSWAVEEKGKGKSKEVEEKGEEHWERETNLSLFGGLISLRMESKKH